jgi:hypothetical protein
MIEKQPNPLSMQNYIRSQLGISKGCPMVTCTHFIFYIKKTPVLPNTGIWILQLLFITANLGQLLESDTYIFVHHNNYSSMLEVLLKSVKKVGINSRKFWEWSYILCLIQSPVDS